MSQVASNPDILGGKPCFVGTRVPVEALLDHLRLGYTIDYFVAQFPTVTRAQAEAVIIELSKHVESNARRVA